MKKIKLGAEVRDKVTGYSGIAVARTEYLQGCARITVQAKVKEDGEVPDELTFDEPLLEVTGRGILPEEKEPAGGPRGISRAK